MTSERGPGTHGPRWRALLEARWQDRLRELTELSLAYHVAVAAAPDRAGAGPAPGPAPGPGPGPGPGGRASRRRRRCSAARSRPAGSWPMSRRRSPG